MFKGITASIEPKRIFIYDFESKMGCSIRQWEYIKFVKKYNIIELENKNHELVGIVPIKWLTNN